MKIPVSLTIIGKGSCHIGFQWRDGKDAGARILSACAIPPKQNETLAVMTDHQTRVVRWATPSDKTSGYVYEYWAMFHNADYDSNHILTIGQIELGGLVE